MKTKEMMYVALFAAIVAVLGILPPIPIPFSPVPITAQTLGVMLAGAILGARLGGMSLLLFVLLVAVGAPILSGGRGGFGVILGPSGGFILSWPIGAFVIGFLVEKAWKSLKFWNTLVFNVIGGIILVYLIGVPYMAMMLDLPLIEATAISSVYIPGDIVKAVVASVIAVQIKKSYPLIQKHQQQKQLNV
ncbi:biotin transporter BioY [Bacillus taeanensis]|uniref:Biotin transporter n=1 Tax=Bacillus taeanensis TaxID=273032 RepID=A0A366XXM4_9BACI|nr:biotin transporter BioY [Bacillus taeanensis]RBW70882.1 biotin transporter BioY [Bacillus taeanensis]